MKYTLNVCVSTVSYVASLFSEMGDNDNISNYSYFFINNRAFSKFLCVITVITCINFRLILVIELFKVVSYSTISRNYYFEIKIY